MSDWQYDMRHHRSIPQPPDLAWQALQQTRLADVPFAGFLLAIRDLPARLTGRPRMSDDVTLLGMADAEGFSIVTTEPPRLLEVASVGRYWQPTAPPGPEMADRDELLAFAEPGWAKVLMYFEFTPEGTGTRMTTGTRIATTDRAARRKFAAYWTVIRPFSGLIRIGMLSAIANRARALDSREKLPG